MAELRSLRMGSERVNRKGGNCCWYRMVYTLPLPFPIARPHLRHAAAPAFAAVDDDLRCAIRRSWSGRGRTATFVVRLARVLDAALQERIHTLWDELAAYEASAKDAAVMHLLGVVAGILGAENAYWMGAVRLTSGENDPFCGWRPRLLNYLRPLPFDKNYTQQRLKSINRGEHDEATVAQARAAGTYRARRLRDLVSPEWFEGDIYKGYVGQGVHDSLTVTAPVGASTEVYYGFLRMRPGDPFTEAERDVAYYAMRGLTWFHRQLLLSHGLLVAQSPLSPSERRVLQLLLTDLPEKAIAAEIGVSPSTLHTYVRDVLRKFGVSGRTGLIALWLGRRS